MHRYWIEFRGTPNKFRREDPHVTLSSRGVILMNRIAHQMFGEPAFVRLNYDRGHGTIGLKPSDGTEPNDFPVKSKFKGASHIIHASPFCRTHRIILDRTKAFNMVTVQGGMLLLELSSMTAVDKGNRKG